MREFVERAEDINRVILQLFLSLKSRVRDDIKLTTDLGFISGCCTHLMQLNQLYFDHMGILKVQCGHPHATSVAVYPALLNEKMNANSLLVLLNEC